MLSDEEMYERMSHGWRAGLYDGTVCGNGSTRANTKNIRAWLPQIVERYGIKTVCDAGAGDLHWKDGMEWSVNYWPFDLIPRCESIKKIDITTEALPKCDMILCRMVLNHLDEMRVKMALHLFKQSGKYLAATQFNGEDLPKRSPQFTRLDLREFGLGEPIEKVQDGAEDWCSLALWKL